MATIKEFTVKNFKGIDDLRIELEGRSSSPVTTLVGLNESGKTTILEAISNFVSQDKLVSSLFNGAVPKLPQTSLIPIHKKAAFTDSVEISALVALESSDVQEIQGLARASDLEIDKDRILKPFVISRKIDFENSKSLRNRSEWEFDLFTKKPQDSEFEEVGDDKNALWLEVADLIEARLPVIAYFPTFIVEIPNKIYLKEHAGETAVNSHYRQIFQAILKEIDGGLDLQIHISKRIDEYKKRRAEKNWLVDFLVSDEKSIIDAVFTKISRSVTKAVLGGWRRVFSKDATARDISIEWHIDTDKDELPYASFIVSDGESKYLISERSLGFRWYFSFLLLTSFKRDDGKSTIYIFDEPAANLHSKAQAELLSTFEKIASGNNRIIYSTHSHHMINPKWLNGAYIIENACLDYDEDNPFELNGGRTNIRATKYREFISKYPTRSSYFQPIIESLEYITPQLIGSPPYVVVEGISDYYALKVAEKYIDSKLRFNIIPGMGSGASGPIISLLMGRGEKFLILLDADKAGDRECLRYKENWHLSEHNVITLGGLNSEFEGMSLESILGSEFEEHIKGKLGLSVEPSKKQVGWYLAELHAKATGTDVHLPRSTVQRLERILNEIHRVLCLHAEAL